MGSGEPTFVPADPLEQGPRADEASSAERPEQHEPPAAGENVYGEMSRAACKGKESEGTHPYRPARRPEHRRPQNTDAQHEDEAVGDLVVITLDIARDPCRREIQVRRQRKKRRCEPIRGGRKTRGARRVRRGPMDHMSAGQMGNG